MTKNETIDKKGHKSSIITANAVIFLIALVAVLFGIYNSSPVAMPKTALAQQWIRVH